METTRKSVGGGIYRLNATLEAINEELMDNGGELTPEIEEALASAELTQVEVVDSLSELLRKGDDEDAALAKEIKRLQGIKKARANALDGLKRYLLNYMLNHNIQKIEGQFCKASVSLGKESVECDTEAILNSVSNTILDAQDSLPPYIILEAKVSKTKLLEYLKTDGNVIPTVKEGNVDVPLAFITRNPFLLLK